MASVPCGQNAPKTSQVAEEMGEVNTQITHIEKATAALDDRLSSILHAGPPTCEEKQKPVNSCVKHAEDLAEMAARIHQVALKLDGLLDRLEL